MSATAALLAWHCLSCRAPLVAIPMPSELQCPCGVGYAIRPLGEVRGEPYSAVALGGRGASALVVEVDSFLCPTCLRESHDPSAAHRRTCAACGYVPPPPPPRSQRDPFSILLH